MSFAFGGSLGFLLPHDISNFEKSIENVFLNKAQITNRMRIDCEIKTQRVNSFFRVLNEVVIHRGDIAKPCLVFLFYNFR